MLRIILYETQKELPKEPSTNPVKFLEEFLKSNIRDAVIGIGHEIDQEIAEWQRNIRGASALSKGVYILSKLPGITPAGFLVSLILSEGAEAGHQAALKLQQLGKSYSYIVRRFYQPTSELNIPRPSF